MLGLHSVLLEYQKYEYEQGNKKIASPGEYFQLVTTHPEFSWLRQISELIASFDEMCEKPDLVNEEKLDGLLLYIKQLLNLDSKSEFTKKYKRAIQINPSVALAHGQVIVLL